MVESTKAGNMISGCDSLPVSQSGKCHDPQSGPRMTAAVRALRLSCRCGRANPRQPSSSPTALPGKIEKTKPMSTAMTEVSTAGVGPPSRMLRPSPRGTSSGRISTTRYQRSPTRHLTRRPRSLTHARLTAKDGDQHYGDRRRHHGSQQKQNKSHCRRAWCPEG